MPPTKVFPLRASAEERARWQAAADKAGLSFNAWARRSLNDQAELDASLEGEVMQESVLQPLLAVDGVLRGSGIGFKGPDPKAKK